MATGDVIQGTVLSVDSVPLGSEIDPSSATAIGTTVITVTDVVDFWQGSKVSIDGVLYSYSNVDDVHQQITLASPGLTAAVNVADPVLLWDVGANSQAVVAEAVVLPQGSPPGDTIKAVIDPGVIPYLPIGPRDPANAQDAENVVCEDRNGVWWVISVGQRNILVAPTIMGGTIIGALVETAESGERVAMATTAPYAVVYFYTGDTLESSPGYIDGSTNGGGELSVNLGSPQRKPFTGVPFPRQSYLTLTTQDSASPSTAQLNAAAIELEGAVTIAPSSLPIFSADNSGVLIGPAGKAIGQGVFFGIVALPSIGAGGTVAVSVTFPTPFATIPVVTASQNVSSYVNVSAIAISGSSPSYTGFTITARNNDTSASAAGQISYIVIG